MSNYCEHAWVPGKFTLIQTNFDPGERPALATGEMMLCSKCAEPELRQLKANHESQAQEIPDLVLRNRALQARIAEMQALLKQIASGIPHADGSIELGLSPENLYLLHSLICKLVGVDKDAYLKEEPHP